ncbi:hypothetical protein BX616_006411 [Lobosporangium transversale]|uniref:Fe2OG dioxygenase domain-containing protein n=1 Tax=Lobosporangium transversale TaxID=64571 RepID=A0A1Y2GDP8_9FUNG|nr:hypothetical protein BCR41DRAFT_326976 [Lobosporangium transversale]KAF9915325.1 hypothetical protein BX616_006411 [Lobosporangium transversale]ORZ06557.1 hypothetical protein BCR41DRAFT_326976 [Lobosporangium transversale]|eukprot:XP_021877600.1 hypothetical protein BCR41DRAFT_326976 [Lobosporangium transversale]
MSTLEHELFGSFDSDDSEHDIIGYNEPVLEKEKELSITTIATSTTTAKEYDILLDNVSLSLRSDPIFQSIMNCTDDEDDSNSCTPSNSRLESMRHHHQSHPYIEGLTLHSNILTHQDQAKLMAQITEKNFFKGGQQNQAMCFGERDLEWLEWLEEVMKERGVLSEPYCRGGINGWTERDPLFDQSIMNLYYPGDGIKPHVDLARFEDGIIIVSLISAINMDFYPARKPMSPEDPPEGSSTSSRSSSFTEESLVERKPSFTVRLKPGSIISMQGPARYLWEHGIQETSQDLVNGEWVTRKIRVSVTLRKMRAAAWEVGRPSALDNGAADRK